jgi:hypothetical protein
MSEFKMGQHDEAIRALQSDVAEIAVDVREIRAILDEKRGERRAASIGFGMFGGAGVTILFRIMAAKAGIHL